MAYQAIGEAMTMAISTSFRKSLESSVTMLATLAPNTLRTPISLVRCSAVKVARPKRPRQEIRMAIPEKMLNSRPAFRSALYN